MSDSNAEIAVTAAATSAVAAAVAYLADQVLLQVLHPWPSMAAPVKMRAKGARPHSCCASAFSTTALTSSGSLSCLLMNSTVWGQAHPCSSVEGGPAAICCTSLIKPGSLWRNCTVQQQTQLCSHCHTAHAGPQPRNADQQPRSMRVQACVHS